MDDEWRDIMWVELKGAVKIDLSRVTAVGISLAGTDIQSPAHEARVYFGESGPAIELHGDFAEQLRKAVENWNQQNPNAKIPIAYVGKAHSAPIE